MSDSMITKEALADALQHTTYQNVMDLCSYFNQERKFYQNVFLNGEKRILKNLLYQTFYKRCYEELLHVQGINDDKYCDFVSAYLASGTTGILIQWLLNENLMDIDKFAKNLYRVQTNIMANISID